MSEPNMRYCILRTLLKAPHLTAAPLLEQQVSAFAVVQSASPGFTASAMGKRSLISDAEVVLFEDRRAAQRLADSMGRDDWKLEVAEISSVAFDVWLYNYCDGSTHVQCRDARFEQARLIFLASVGFATQGGWMVRMDVACEHSRQDWREYSEPAPIDVVAGQLSYNAWNAARIHRGQQNKLAARRGVS